MSENIPITVRCHDCHSEIKFDVEVSDGNIIVYVKESCPECLNESYSEKLSEIAAGLSDLKKKLTYNLGLV